MVARGSTPQRRRILAARPRILSSLTGGVRTEIRRPAAEGPAPTPPMTAMATMPHLLPEPVGSSVFGKDFSQGLVGGDAKG
jgi:hypothetical protein